MEFSGMNKTSEETLSYLSSSATAHPSLYKTLRYSPGNEYGEKSLSHSSPEGQVLRLVDAFHCPFNNDLRECESPQIPMVSAMCNRLVPSDISSGFVDRSEFDHSKVLNNNEKPAAPEVGDTTVLLKPDLNDKAFPCSATKVVNNSPSPASNLIPDAVCIPSPCNGSLSRPESNSDESCQVDKPETGRDVNGCRPTDVSPTHDQERAKMDLDKLDETIDYVLSVARSDEPCEGMFVLTCRARESTVTSSPNPRVNTPSSELINSPTISPAPSPHSNNLNSPVLQTCKTQAVFQSNSSCSMVSPQPMQRYIVDQTHGIIQLSSNPSQCVSAHYGNQGVSFVQLCSDSSSNPVFQVSQHHIVSQISQPLTTNTHVLFHPSMLHSFQNHPGQQAQFTIPHSTLPTASVQRISTPILSPVRTSVLQNVVNQVAKSSDTNITSYPVSNHIIESTNPPISTQAVSINPPNICVVQSPQSLLCGTVGTPVSLEASGDVKYSLSVPTVTNDQNCSQTNSSVAFRHPIIPVNTTSPMLPTSSIGVSSHGLPVTNSHITTCSQSITSTPRKRSHASTSGNNKRRKTVGSPSYPVVPVSNKNITVHEASIRSLHSGAQEQIDKLKGVDLKSLVSAPTLQPFFSVLPPTGSCDSPFPRGADEAFYHKHGLKYSRGRMSLKFPKCIDRTTSHEVVDSYLTQHLKVVVPPGPVIYPSKCFKRQSVECHSVCASPEPPSFENNMKTLFSRMNQFTKKYSKDVYDETKVGYDSCKLSGETLIPQPLLQMFSQNPSNSLERTETDRCTPPLALYHMPNPRLLCQPIHLAPCSGTVYSQETCRYSEEPVSITSILASRNRSAKSCKMCGKPVSPHMMQRKWLDELCSVSGISMNFDNAVDLLFCSSDCLYGFARLLSCYQNKYSETSLDYSSQTDILNIRNCYNFEQQRQLIMTDFPCSMPILLQNNLSKSKPNLKRQHPQQCVTNKKRSTNTSTVPSKFRKWQGIRWRQYVSDTHHPSDTSSRRNIVDDALSPFISNPAVMRAPHSEDKRLCDLCHQAGDAPEDGAGRLLPLDLDNWIHINCALWCYEVYETIGGSLNNLDVWLAKAKETACTQCGLLGAGLPCYNPKCSYVYHVPCAIKIRCMFFTDRGMYCPQHQPKEIHPMQLSSLAVSRRVYISRDENSQVARVVHEDSDKHVVRIGGVSLHSIGQLLPHQIDSGNFHNRRNIYPTGMCSTRIYWSMRRPRSRAKYVCEILEKDSHPFFRITAIDRDMENVSVTHETCDGAWQIILSRIEVLCKEHKLVKLFPQLLRGEDLFGLNESHIVRAVESLPGVEGLRDYVFNFGRLELISEMPLAINPSGCARSEPKMQTYVKRMHDAGEYSISFNHRTSLPGVRRLSHPSFNGTTCSNGVYNIDTASKQHQSSRSQQYRKLKTEVNSNVILGRSRIQGLGLFAARDLEQQTMVIEYVGELIRLEIANKREKNYEAHNRGIYMFRLDDDTVIDATVCGGLARYINHSCQPNCLAEFVNFGGHSHIVIITNRRIKKGEELCYDYNFDLEDRSDKIPCLCRAPNCRKWMN
ncbi:mixed-lineage leukemia protein, mll, putative [Schistosoma mansoni]|uniref:mixed-lineage leukemia protein, mll, putative n=1 Tax=Schistosoma mansoni TaxID=6183 RepID=UPI0001A63BBD|nr:mixed-lineage leukemia protein, mll, putative [Schistosoma mansoni]|eukprot:XP_018646764.1 mixed-lineage leukemia protein, mll, putative [Schistosoma mansoni]